jgi:spore germination protein GerM
VPLAAGTIYLADPQQQLVAVPVQVPDAQAAPMLQSLLNRLAVGPSDRERARGLVTDLGPGSTIVLRSISAGTANIELTGQDPSPSKLPVAVGQIVLTATSIVGIERVVFARDGVAVAVPGPSGGGLTADPLVRSDYDGLLAPGQPPVDRAVPLPGTPAPTTTTER